MIQDLEQTLEAVKKQIGIQQIDEEILGLLKLLQERDVKHILEIGCASGGVSTLFSFFAKTLVSVDWEHCINAPTMESLGKRCNFRLVVGDTHKREVFNKVLKRTPYGKFDFALIDGDHSYAGVKKDFEWYSKLVKPGGIIAFHDIAAEGEKYRKLNCYVDVFWKEIKLKYKHQEIRRPGASWAGIGVIFKP